MSIRIQGFSQTPMTGILKGTRTKTWEAPLFPRQYVPPRLISSSAQAFFLSPLFFLQGSTPCLFQPCGETDTALLLNFHQLSSNDRLYLLGYLRA